MAGTSINMSKVKQLLQLKQSGMSNRQIAKMLCISRDKANEFVKQAESDPLGNEGKEFKFFEKVEHLDLLIIDDFGMKKLEGQQQNDFEQIIDDRYHKKAFASSKTVA